MIGPDLVKILREVPKEIIECYASQLGGNFVELLERAAVFEFAEMTPIFLMTPDEEHYTVSSIETYNRRLH